MARSYASKAAYDRICTDCTAHTQPRPSQHVCEAARDLITGRTVPLQCATARGPTGHCGPEGRNFSPSSVVHGAAVVPMRKAS